MGERTPFLVGARDTAVSCPSRIKSDGCSGLSTARDIRSSQLDLTLHPNLCQARTTLAGTCQGIFVKDMGFRFVLFIPYCMSGLRQTNPRVN